MKNEKNIGLTITILILAGIMQHWAEMENVIFNYSDIEVINKYKELKSVVKVAEHF